MTTWQRPAGWRELCCAIVLVILAPAAPAQTAAPIPAEAFFAPAKLQDAQLSPGGRWLAALTSLPGRKVGFLMMDLEGQEASRFVEASDKDDVIWFQWVSDDWLVFRVRDPLHRGVRRQGSGLMTMRRDGSESRLLIARSFEPEDPFRKRRYLEPSHRYLALGAPDSHEVVVGEARYAVNGEYTHTIPKALNVITGALRTLQDGAPSADRWWFDSQGRARAASLEAEGLITTWWADEKGAWRQIAKAPAFEQAFTPVYVEGRDSLVVRTSDATGSLELRRFDFASGKPEPQALVRTADFDGGARPVRVRTSGEVLGVQLAVDAEVTVWFSPAMKRLQEKVDAKFPGRINLLQCQPCSDTAPVLVHTHSDVDPGSFVLYRQKDEKWLLVGQVRPDIDARKMARLELHRTSARDGRGLPVWVTRPAAAAGERARPAVVMVHGGPHLRGTYWRWDAEAQFLASRGYVVIEPEFRGSRGYGWDHFQAGWKQWGQAMQDDVTDALRFAAGKGWVDPSRVCILGSSYGGYASLMGLVKDPGQYRCGVAHAAVSDPRNLFDFHWSDISEEARDFGLPVLLGDPKKDAAMLAAVSPLEQVARIRAPVLLVHGGRDRRVPIENGERMRDALRQNGKSVDWVVYPEEAHSFFFLENQLDYWRRVEVFLGKHLQ